MKKTFSILSLILIAFSSLAQNNTNMKTDIKNNSDATIVNITTTLGDIKVKLYDDTPKHRDNFIKLVKDGFYDGVLFHRVINKFMVQTGDPNSKTAIPGQMLGAGDPGYEIDAEIIFPRHYHKYGALAAARTGDEVNPQKKSSGSQFYIVTGDKYDEATLNNLMKRSTDQQRQAYFQNLVRQNREKIQNLINNDNKAALDSLQQEYIALTIEAVKEAKPTADMIQDYTTIGGTPHLDAQYTVFGEVISGMDVVEKIQNSTTDKSDRPVDDIKIISATIEENTNSVTKK